VPANYYYGETLISFSAENNIFSYRIKWILDPASGAVINGGDSLTSVCLTTNVIAIGDNAFRKTSITSIFISS
jgi:hypothetical protein